MGRREDADVSRPGLPGRVGWVERSETHRNEQAVKVIDFVFAQPPYDDAHERVSRSVGWVERSETHHFCRSPNAASFSSMFPAQSSGQMPSMNHAMER